MVPTEWEGDPVVQRKPARLSGDPVLEREKDKSQWQSRIYILSLETDGKTSKLGKCAGETDFVED